MHYFEPSIAKRVGVNAAVLYQNIVFWAEHNMRNGKSFRDGLWWTYNSRKAFSHQFDYLTEKQIRLCLDKLVKAGLIVKGEYNKANYDKTSWYSPACSVDWVPPTGPKGPMERPEKANGTARKGQPIPDSKPDHKPDDPYGCDQGQADFLEGFEVEAVKPKPKRATSIPENWVPSDKNISDALAKDFTQQEINEQGERFRDYHLAKGSTFKNWDAAWRTWLGNARSFNARRGAVTRSGGFGSGTAQAFADLAREGRDGEG